MRMTPSRGAVALSTSVYSRHDITGAGKVTKNDSAVTINPLCGEAMIDNLQTFPVTRIW